MSFQCLARTYTGVEGVATYVATYETMANAKRITPVVVQPMCFGDRMHTSTS